MWPDALIEFNWLSTRHGALVKAFPVHPENDLYDATPRMFLLQSPFRRGQTEAAVRLLSDGRFVNLDEDLRHSSKIYAGILANRDDGGFGLASLRRDRYRRARRRYYAYVEEQRSEVEAMRARLASLYDPGRPVVSPR